MVLVELMYEAGMLAAIHLIQEGVSKFQIGISQIKSAMENTPQLP